MPRGPIERTLNFVDNPTFGGVAKFADGTAAAPSIAFANYPTDGVFHPSGEDVIAITGGSGKDSVAFNVGAAGTSPRGVRLASDGQLSWFDTTSLATATANDLFLTRDAANVLALRNGVNAQAFRVYNTYTDASNYERGFLRWTGSVLGVGTEAAGTGSQRVVNLTGNSLWFSVNGTTVWTMSASGHFLANADNTYDIGASGANRPQMVHVGTDITVGRDGNFSRWVAVNPDSGGLYLNGRAFVRSSASGVIRLTNENDNDFSRLQFGGTTSAFPALKRSNANIHVVLGDDSNYTSLLAAGLLATSSTIGMGYSTGAGGTVTQITSKATGVTLNTVTGNITTTADALAADAAVSFTLTDSAIAATDLVAVSHHSGGTAGAYTLTAQAAAGSAVVTIRNVTAGALSEALVIKFAVIKGATA